MPVPALLLLIATLLPLASFTLLVVMGKRLGNPLAGYVATTMIAGSWVLSLAALVSWYQLGEHAGIEWGAGVKPILQDFRWIPVGGGVEQNHPGYLDVGVYVDSLTLAMFNMITLVATLIHIFSLGYMNEDSRFPRYFTYLGLFCFSMLGLVLGSTLLQLFIFWELVGLCSYLLIGFWYESPAACNAATKAFIINRIGDFGFLVGFGILFYFFGNADLLDISRFLGSAGLIDGIHQTSIHLPNGMTASSTMLTLMGVGLFCGAMGKSAQFPLHVWLPDAMEGPTPVSALIHAATMVVAGVYLTARIFPILTPDARLFIAVIGLITLTMAALIAMAQTDIKRVLAFSTVSQLGFMVLALGIGSWVGALFHLITHAFFKALLFLGAGSVIHAAGHEQEMSEFGGLFRRIPVTAITFAIGVLAIAGTPFFSGFYSKDMILGHAGAYAALASQSGRSAWYWAFFILPTAASYLTAFYMMRCWMLTFWGKPRDLKLYATARETPIMWFPLVVLAGLSIVGGSQLLDIKHLLTQSQQETRAYCLENPPAGVPAFSGFDQTWSDDAPSAVAAGAATNPLQIGARLVRKYVYWAFAVGIGLGFLVYMNGFATANAMMRIPGVNMLRHWLYHRMYFDELYYSVFVAATVAIGNFCGVFDRLVIDGLVKGAASMVRQAANLAGLADKYIVDGAANGTASLAQNIGQVARAGQTGRIRVYVTILIVALAAGLAGAICLVAWHGKGLF